MARQIDVPIPHDTALGLIEDGLKAGVNKNMIAEFLMETMDKESIAMMIMLLQLKEQYVPIIPGDYVTFHVKAGWFADNIDIDVMIDLGLSVNNHYYARIPQRDSYGNDINKFSTRLDVEFMTYDEEKNLIYKKERIDRTACRVITADIIPYFQLHVERGEDL